MPKYPAATTPPPRLTFQQKIKRQIRRVFFVGFANLRMLSKSAFDQIKIMSKYGIEKDNVVKTQNLDENLNEIMKSSYEKVYKTAKKKEQRELQIQFTPSEDASYASHLSRDNNEHTKMYQVGKFASNEKDQTVNLIEISALYCAILFYIFFILRINLWQQRRRTAVFVGDDSI
ncbi:2286_t:CDS:2 [Ambispora leptoticha]|uniref:2286_t:CDS:1 n=1 Tax=Ambispora leptoticha TaxID=144679 RepID=A0A9N9CIX7_9GLOM|nr:2286_t:CDS:2 [Ambispora leptoticha]